ncbi:MAG: 16S rRNA (guanine(966)-N(2))-methyltransferase RsmD [Nitrospirae bacterium]|nr:16S rRNA (guanine(966)-N(2))-methyltransferase RsmD [Nitrospirota bacterium]
MRVTGGTERGRRLKAPAGSRVRPTSDKVKQALFNILGERVADALFLDLFAGVGGIGIEALSRGAGRVVFVDASRASLQVLNENLEQTGFKEQSQTVLSKAESFLKKPSGLYDVVYLDPPYADEMQPLLELIAGANILKPDSIVIAEHFKKQPSPASAGGLTLYREANYGDTVLAFYTFSSQKSGDSHAIA